MAGSLLVFKNGTLIAWPKKTRRKERKTLRERERERVGRGGEHTIVIIMCVQ